ncbi:MAG: ABC transporter substrate-binding protein [Nitrospirae bacterium]|nr:MAG: ABC transporter substrate-binding protein [Nitrospirota bacterium]
MTSPWKLLAAALCLSLMSPACTSKNRLEGYLYQRLNADPTTLDPAFIVDVTGGSIAAKLFNGLVRLDPDLNIVPDIAGKWDIRDSGKVYTFYLNRGVRFFNGREVTAEDFRFSFRRILHPLTRSPNTWVFDSILGAEEFMKGQTADVRGIEVLDAYTLRITLRRSFAPFMNLLTMTAAYVVPGEEIERKGPEFSFRPVGTGPFILKSWEHNTELALKANEGYFAGPPKIRGIIYRVIPEDLTAVTEFELGNLDVIAVPAYEFARYSRSQEWQGLISSGRGLNTYYLGFNCSRPPFDDAALRRAVAGAIDREKILATFYEKRGRIARGPVPDLLRQWDAPALHPYDPAKSMAVIDGSGIKSRVVTFYVNADQEVIDLAEIIQSYLKTAGITVAIKQLEWSAFKSAINKGEADMFWLSWWADYPDPENFLFPLFHSSNHGPSGNRARYTNREVDRLIEAGQRTPDRSLRNQYYMKAERIIAEESPWVFFWHKTDFIVKQQQVKDHRIYPIYTIDKGTGVSF